MSWTSERVELLTKLWGDGLSASQIAAELGGVTRNAVIGKVHRLGLSGRAKTSVSSAPKSRKAPARQSAVDTAAPQTSPTVTPRSVGATALKADIAAAPQAKPEQKPVAEVVPIAKRATILTLTERTCKWPIGDPTSDDFHFCGHASQAGMPYCPYHCRMAYQPASDRRRDRNNAATG